MPHDPLTCSAAPGAPWGSVNEKEVAVSGPRSGYVGEKVTNTKASPSFRSEPAYPHLNFDGPDNVTVTPWGSLVLAEDGVGASHVLSATPGGPTYAIARNMLNIGDQTQPEYSEFTGPTFSADGRFLYVNIQNPGLTLAITGPWKKYLD
jgi:secreted PhoX family phosphatase